jgi:hypothetical protein
MAYLEHVSWLAFMPSKHEQKADVACLMPTHTSGVTFTHNILPQHTDGDQLKHGYDLC